MSGLNKERDKELEKHKVGQQKEAFEALLLDLVRRRFLPFSSFFLLFSDLFSVCEIVRDLIVINVDMNSCIIKKV